MSNIYISIRNAKRRAKDLLESLALNNQRIFPLDIYSIALNLGADVREVKFLERKISGFIKRDTKEGKPIIAVNEEDPLKRKRFTVAHELGHFLLHLQEDNFHIDEKVEMVHFRNEISSTATQEKEIAANQFAAELLMPTEEVAKKLEESKDEDPQQTTARLAEYFGVSDMAMKIRIECVV